MHNTRFVMDALVQPGASMEFKTPQLEMPWRPYVMNISPWSAPHFILDQLFVDSVPNFIPTGVPASMFEDNDFEMILDVGHVSVVVKVTNTTPEARPFFGWMDGSSFGELPPANLVPVLRRWILLGSSQQNEIRDAIRAGYHIHYFETLRKEPS